MNLNWSVISLELSAIGLGLILLISGLTFFRKKDKAFFGYVSIIGLLAMLAASFYLPRSASQTFLNGFYVQDSMALYFKRLFIVVAIFVNGMALNYMKNFTKNRTDFFALIFFALAGMMVMASSAEFITLYVGMELMTLTNVLLTAYKKHDVRSGEAGLKYILLNAVSSGIFLYGLSLLYGLVGTLDFATMITVFKTQASSPLLIMAIVMVLAGFSFKISLVPFQMWAPDIYEGAPTPIAAFLAVGSKAAGFVAIIRVFFLVFASYATIFIPLLVVLAILTLLIGNLIAMAQTHLKRLLAYSSIAHAGYLILGVIAYTKLGLGAILFYLLIYLFANISAFTVATILVMQTGDDRIEDLSGLWKRSPLMSSVLIISLLSLAGIPPTAGFIGKFYLILEVIHQGYLWLAILAIAMNVVAIYYYLMVIRTCVSGLTEAKPRLVIPKVLTMIMIVSTAMTLLIGIFPSFFTNYFLRIAQGF